MDRVNFENLYIAYETALYNTVYRWIWDESEAMDLVQEAYMKLWSRREQIREDEAKAYLFKTALNLASNRLRSRKLWQWTGLDGLLSRNGDSEKKMVLDERETQVRAALNALPEKFKTVLVLARFSEMKYAEIATVLAIPEGTVASRYHKGIALLKDKLGGSL